MKLKNLINDIYLKINEIKYKLFLNQIKKWKIIIIC